MGWFSKEKSLAECEKISKDLSDIKDLPQECQKYDSVVDAVKKKSDIAFKGSVGRRATKHGQLVRRMTNTKR